MKDSNCAYCVEGDKLDAFGIKITELPASKVYLFKEQSHLGRVIVASKFHVSELVDLTRRERQDFMDDVTTVAAAIHKIFSPKKVNYGAFGDTGSHLHFHLVPKYENDDFEWGTTFAMNPKRKFLSAKEYAEITANFRGELYLGNGFDFRKSLSRMHRDIVADGKIDFYETSILLKALAPLESSGASIAKFVKMLREVRSDGVISDEESAALIKAMEELLV